MTKEAERVAALYAYAAGVPSTLPSTNRYKTLVQDHRWGEHREGPVNGCPVCEEGK